MKRKLWTREELDYLFKNYNSLPTYLIAENLNRSVKSVYSAAHIHSLVKSEDFFKSSLSGRKQKGCKNNFGTFIKGHIPHNKGQKMSNSTYSKVKKTMFKIGHKPHNTKYDGYERIDSKDGYILIRVNGKFRLKHRVIWELNNGPIHQGAIIKFKDGNPQNVDISNLYMSDKSSNMRDNTIHKYPEQIKTLIRLNSKLKKTIHEKQN